MDTKKEIGKRIQRLRLDRKLTREQLCQDESQVTVRQLGRIETGQSLPSLSTSIYLASELGVTVNDLIDETSVFLPQGYLDLKYKIFRTATYGDKKRVEERQRDLDKIYANYFDVLPEEEQLVVQILQSLLDISSSRNALYDQGLLDKYLEKVEKNKVLTVNDLLLINLYFTSMKFGREESVSSLILLEKVLDASLYLSKEDYGMIQNVLITIGGTYMKKKEYHLFPKIITTLNLLIEQGKDYRYRPHVELLDWKYQLFIKKDRAEAKKRYEKALLVAEMIGDDVLLKNIRQEWEKDKETSK